MCGIAEIFSYHDNGIAVDQSELLRMRDHMFDRGPDGAGLWIDSNARIGLGHRRLAILDLTENGKQPMSTPDGQLHIVFNGEIYNYPALKAALAHDYSFRSNSDTELLLALYLKYGEKMVHHLRGMYAFAIWDKRASSMFLARDPLGIKPIYYADNGKTFRLASQVKALLKGGKIDTTPEPAGHVGFFIWGAVPDPRTLTKSNHLLPATA